MDAVAIATIVLSLLAGEFAVDCYDAPVATLASGGKVLGRRLDILGTKVDAFLGVRYAEAPVGDLRFQVARPVSESWERGQIQNATLFGSACWQVYPGHYNDFTGHVWWSTTDAMSEDCLFLNVWTPYPKPSDSPVFVFIHGGSFQMGSTSTLLYRGDTLAAVENCVVVSMNYRLGSLGFSAFYTENEPGNLGLIDQAMALMWVKRNIAHFGGDPKRVTLIGHSAGAASVGFHLLSPLSRSRNLFHRAILQSGVPNAPWAMTYKNDTLWAVGKMAKALNCPTWFLNPRVEYGEIVQETLSCLRERDPSEFYAINWNTSMPILNTVVVDGHFLPDDPQEMLAMKKVKKKRVPILIGTVNDDSVLNIPLHEFSMWAEIEEILLTYDEETYNAHVDLLLASPGRPIADAVAFQYRDWSDPHNGERLHRSIIDMWGDYCMLCPIKEFAKYYSMTGNDVYAYNFYHRPTNSPYPHWMGILHADDLSFTLGRALHEEENLTDDEKRLSRRIMRYMGNFGRTGNPNEYHDFSLFLQTWPKHTVDSPVHLTLNQDLVESHAPIGRFGKVTECAFWSQLVPRLANELYRNKGTQFRPTLNQGFHPIYLDSYMSEVEIILPDDNAAVGDGRNYRCSKARRTVSGSVVLVVAAAVMSFSLSLGSHTNTL